MYYNYIIHSNIRRKIMFEKIKRMAFAHPLLMSVVASVLIGIVGTCFLQIISLNFSGYEIATGAFIGCFLVYPLVLTGIETCLLIGAYNRESLHRRGRLFDIVTILLGILYSILYLDVIKSVVFSSDWTEVLVNAQKHTPVFTQALPTVLTIAAVGCTGYIMVNYIPLKKMPPLILVTGIAAMYLGTLESILWGIQVCKGEALDEFYLLLLPVNCVMITARTVACKIREWRETPHELHKIDQILILHWCDQILERSEMWPIAAFFLMWPLLGILIAVLVLFGQAPNAVIRTWTETSDWNLSQRIAPQNVYYDEHYLCTVAAGGHRKIVKPLRLGVRHGHEIIVNRQLCVANAFEQILEEKTPYFHKAVRTFYNRYGFPVAKLIRSPYAADMVYFLMKPLEWIFLTVLYLTDVHPEDRIAVQYTGTSRPAILSTENP